MKDKRGVSKIIVTVLMILQIVVAITIISAFIYKIFDNFNGELSFENKISQYEIKEVKLWLTGGAAIKVKSNSVAENMNSIKIIFYDKNRDSHDIIISDPDRLPGLHETKTIILSMDEVPINNSDIESLTVFPTDGKNFGLESKEPEVLVQRDTSGNRILDAPPEAISWWRFDKTPRDHLGYNHGELLDGAIINKDGQLELNGDGAYVEVGHHENLDIKDSDWTISVWAKPDQLSAGQYILSKRNLANRADGQYAISLYENTFRAYLFDTYAKNTNGQEWINADQWIYLTAVYEKSDSMRTFVNGVFDREIPISSSSYFVLEDSPFQIGCLNKAQCFNGLIDDVILFEKALTQSEIQAVYNNQMKV
ncbi:MAG: LamG domain-containing protein [Phycisphaerae bacterium]|nr:LamG domain-containing protein [Phycisphaerae bacterium]